MMNLKGMIVCLVLATLFCMGLVTLLSGDVASSRASMGVIFVLFNLVMLILFQLSRLKKVKDPSGDLPEYGGDDSEGSAEPMPVFDWSRQMLIDNFFKLSLPFGFMTFALLALYYHFTAGFTIIVVKAGMIIWALGWFIVWSRGKLRQWAKPYTLFGFVVFVIAIAIDCYSQGDTAVLVEATQVSLVVGLVMLFGSNIYKYFRHHPSLFWVCVHSLRERRNWNIIFVAISVYIMLITLAGAAMGPLIWGVSLLGIATWMEGLMGMILLIPDKYQLLLARVSKKIIPRHRAHLPVQYPLYLVILHLGLGIWMTVFCLTTFPAQDFKLFSWEHIVWAIYEFRPACIQMLSIFIVFKSAVLAYDFYLLRKENQKSLAET